MLVPALGLCIGQVLRSNLDVLATVGAGYATGSPLVASLVTSLFDAGATLGIVHGPADAVLVMADVLQHLDLCKDHARSLCTNSLRTPPNGAASDVSTSGTFVARHSGWYLLLWLAAIVPLLVLVLLQVEFPHTTTSDPPHCACDKHQYVHILWRPSTVGDGLQPTHQRGVPRPCVCHLCAAVFCTPGRLSWQLAQGVPWRSCAA